jgi:hypothetical protein
LLTVAYRHCLAATARTTSIFHFHRIRSWKLSKDAEDCVWFSTSSIAVLDGDDFDPIERIFVTSHHHQLSQ